MVRSGGDFDTFVDTWNHVACTWDGRYLRLCYWNGVEVASEIITTAHNTLAGSFIIGARPTCRDSGRFVCMIDGFQGHIDNVGVWNVSLSGAEIVQTLVPPTPPPTPAPTAAPSVAYWSTEMEYVIEKGEFEQQQLTEEELPPSRTHWDPDSASPPRATDTCKGCFGETLHIVGKSQIAPENQEYS